MNQPATDIDALKSRLKATWMAGDFGLIAKSYESGATEFVRRLELISGKRVLDVACGTGNLPVLPLFGLLSGKNSQSAARPSDCTLSAEFSIPDARECRKRFQAGRGAFVRAAFVAPNSAGCISVHAAGRIGDPLRAHFLM